MDSWRAEGRADVWMYAGSITREAGHNTEGEAGAVTMVASDAARATYTDQAAGETHDSAQGEGAASPLWQQIGDHPMHQRQRHLPQKPPKRGAPTAD